MNRHCFVSLIIFITASISEAQTPAASNPSGMSKMYGEIAITNNYVDRGLTQSDKAPSVYAGAGYWFGPNGRIAFGANSVKYEREEASVEMRLLGEFKFMFTNDTGLKIRNDFVRYFQASTRNRIELSVDLDLATYHFIILRDDNFEGTTATRTWYGFSKLWPWGTSSNVETTVGYSIIPNYNSYFDTKLGLNYLSGNITYSVFNTWVSSASQFSGRGEMAFFAAIAAKF